MPVVITQFLLRTLFASIVGAIIAAAPIFWGIMELDMKLGDNIKQEHIITILGIAAFDYKTLTSLVGEVLMCGIGLGVTASLNWLESNTDSKSLGTLASIFSSLAAIGALMSLILYTGIYRAKMQPEVFQESFTKYIQASYIIFTGIVISYFASMLQIRRVKDLEKQNG